MGKIKGFPTAGPMSGLSCPSEEIPIGLEKGTLGARDSGNLQHLSRANKAKFARPNHHQKITLSYHFQFSFLTFHCKPVLIMGS